MMESGKLQGVIVPLITPLQSDERVDEVSLRRMVDYVLTGGKAGGEEFYADGIFVNSTTGEGLALRDEEQARALEIVVDQVAGRTVVMGGVSDTSTRRALDKLESIQAAGADMAVAHPPFYYPCNDQSELVDYFTEIAGHAKIPVMLYNIPSMAKSALSVEAVRQLSANDCLVGIKDSSGDYLFLIRLIEMKRKFRPDFRVFIGKSQLWTAGVAAGADGMLDGISNLIPRHCAELFRMIREGRLTEAFMLQEEINAIWDIYQTPSFLSAIKSALKLLGLCEDYVTSPVKSISEQDVARIRAIMVERGLLER